jgi:hypothetical protein
MRFSMSAICRRSSSNGVLAARDESSFAMLAAIASRWAHSSTSDSPGGGTAGGLTTWPDAAPVPKEPATTQQISMICHAAERRWRVAPVTDPDGRTAKTLDEDGDRGSGRPDDVIANVYYRTARNVR